MQKSLLNSEEAALKELEKQYAQALKEIQEKVKLFQVDIDLLDQALSQDGMDEATKAMLKSRKQSKIYQQQYQKALQDQVGSILNKMHGDNYATIDKYLKECYESGYIGTMYSIANQGIPIITPIDQSAVVKAVLTDSKVSNGLYNALGVNVDKLKKTITQEISRGIATGMGYTDMARNISSVSKAPLSRTKTIARTEGHRIQSAATYQAALDAKANGADIVKQWDAALDGRTRDSHRRVDGEIKELEETFSNGLLYPGDPSGSAAEVVNCRCVALTRARWALDEDELEELKQRAAFFGLDKTENFKEFENKYLNAAKTVEKEAVKTPKTLENSGKSDILNMTEMLAREDDARKGFKFISDERFATLTIEARKKGATIIRGTKEVERHLTDMRASASTLGDVLMFKKDVCVSEVLEETFHYLQNVNKVNDDKGEPLRSILNEISAKEYIIENAEKYKVPRNELELVKRQLREYKRQLEEYRGGVNDA